MSNSKKDFYQIELIVFFSITVLLFWANCMSYSEKFEELGPIDLVIIYHGSMENRPIQQIFFHSQQNNYNDFPNLLDTPLQIEDSMEISDIEPGNYYVTIVRKQRPIAESPNIALTTKDPLLLESGKYEFFVFDKSFRLEPPVDNQVVDQDVRNDELSQP